MNQTNTYQEVANAAGYFATLTDNGEYQFWKWKHESNGHSSLFPFGSKETAYENCCVAMNLSK